MLKHVESLSRLLKVVLLSGLVLQTGALSHESQAQAVRTFLVQDGKAYIDGRQVPADAMPASLNLADVELQFQFSGEIEPVISLNGQLYRIEENALTEVAEVGRSPQAFSMMFDIPVVAPVLRNDIVPAPFGYSAVVPSIAAADSPVALIQDMLEQQALEVGRLSEQIAQQNQLDRVAALQGNLQSSGVGRASLFRQPLSAMSPQEAAFLTEKLRLQAKRMALAARQLPQIEIKSYLDDVQEYDSELYQRLVREQRLERESLDLARRVRLLPQGTERSAREGELRSKLEEIFELKQENRRREITQLKEQLAQLQKRLDQRERLRKDIIDKRMRELAGSSNSQR